MSAPFPSKPAILLAALPGAILPTLPEKVNSNLQRSAQAQADYLQKRALVMRSHAYAHIVRVF